MNHDLLDNNKVFLQGKVTSEPTFSHEIFDEAFYNLNLAIPRLSGQEDIIPITISDRLLENKKLKIGDMIAIKGQFRSYNKIEDEKSKLILTVFVREICDYDQNANPNTIEIFGYICKSPIYRTTPFNREITDMLMAVNRSYNKSDHIPCITWGRNARFASGFEVGGHVQIWGRIQSREYVKKLSETQTEKRVAYEVSVSKLEVVEDAD